VKALTETSEPIDRDSGSRVPTNGDTNPERKQGEGQKVKASSIEFLWLGILVLVLGTPLVWFMDAMSAAADCNPCRQFLPIWVPVLCGLILVALGLVSLFWAKRTLHVPTMEKKEMTS